MSHFASYRKIPNFPILPPISLDTPSSFNYLPAIHDNFLVPWPSTCNTRYQHFIITHNTSAFLILVPSTFSYKSGHPYEPCYAVRHFLSTVSPDPTHNNAVRRHYGFTSLHFTHLFWQYISLIITLHVLQRTELLKGCHFSASLPVSPVLCGQLSGGAQPTVTTLSSWACSATIRQIQWGLQSSVVWPPI